MFFRGKLANTSDAYIEKLDNIEINKYNSNFTKYSNYSDLTITISAQEVVTAIQVAKEADLGTKVFIKFLNAKDYGTGYSEFSSYQDYAYDKYFDENLFLKNHLMHRKADGTYNSFEFIRIEYNEYGVVSEIYFNEVEKK